MTDTAARFQEGSTKATALGLTTCTTGMKPAVDQLSSGAKDVLKASYLAKVDGICDVTERAVDALPDPDKLKGVVAAGRWFDKFIPVIEKMVADLKALPAPPGDEVIVAEIMAAQDGALAKLKEFRSAAVANDARKVLILEEEVGSTQTLADAKMVSYGLKSCGDE